MSPRLPRTRRIGGRASLDGVLVVAKPSGPTSHDVVALVRRLAATHRVGHGGTLDPFASGVLPLFLGRATRVAEYHVGDPKAYRATVCFGAASATDDLEGELVPVDAPPPDRDTVEGALARFRGPIRQRPPAYSAVKVGGRRAYALARAGETPVLRVRDVTIERLELVEWDASDPARPVAVLEVECSAGTYLRALARDLGAAVGSAAYLGALVRTRSGPFRLEDALSLDRVRAAAEAGPEGIRRLLRPIDVGLAGFPIVRVDREQLVAVAQGQFVRLAGLPPAGGLVRVYGPEDRIVAIGRVAGGRVAPAKLLVDVGAILGAGRAAAGAGEAAELVEAALAAERDPGPDTDPDPVTPDAE